jgi:hypothetical protein
MADPVYPGAIPTIREVKDRNLATGELGDIVVAEDHNQIARELVSALTVLGLWPAGGDESVSARLDKIEGNISEKKTLTYDGDNEAEQKLKEFSFKLGGKFFKLTYDSDNNKLTLIDSNFTPFDELEFGGVPYLNLYATEILLNCTKLGFFGGARVEKTAVEDPTAIVTTETAGDNYTATEKAMLGHLKDDVTNLQSKLTAVIDALQALNLV